MNKLNGFAATYFSQDSIGIYHFEFEPSTGEISLPHLLYQAPDAKYLSLYKNLLVSPIERNHMAGICILSLDKKNQSFINGSVEIFCEKQTACFVAQEENYIYTANFHEGTVLVYEKNFEKNLHAISGVFLKKRIKIAPKAGCHQILFYKDKILVPCMNLDKIKIFDKNLFTEEGELSFPTQSGPRHGTFNKDHSMLYVVGQISNELFVYQIKDDQFQLIQQLSIMSLPTGISESAAIRLSPDEKFLYISVRGADSIIVFEINRTILTQIQQIDCGGKHPRDFIISPDGKFLLVANRYSNEIVLFCRNIKTGKIENQHTRVPLFEGVGLLLNEN